MSWLARVSLTRRLVAAAVLGAALVLAVQAAEPADAAGVKYVRCNVEDLMDAIDDANTSGPTVLQLSPFCVYTIETPATATTGLPVITGEIVLKGGVMTVLSRPSSAPQFRILDVGAGAKLTLTNLTIKGGNTSGLGGAVQNAGDLFVNQVTFTQNTAANGGAIANIAGGTANVLSSTFTQNRAGSVGGGAIMTFDKLNVSASNFTRNTAPINGGGINVQPGGDATFRGVLLERNTSGSLGGGLSNLGSVKFVTSSIVRNTGSGGGGIATGNNNVELISTYIKFNIPDDCSPAGIVCEPGLNFQTMSADCDEAIVDEHGVATIPECS